MGNKWKYDVYAGILTETEHDILKRKVGSEAKVGTGEALNSFLGVSVGGNMASELESKVSRLTGKTLIKPGQKKYFHVDAKEVVLVSIWTTRTSRVIATNHPIPKNKNAWVGEDGTLKFQG